jgi:GTP cyclohydrolase I
MEQIQLIKDSQSNRPITDKQREKLIKKATKSYGKFLTDLGFDWEQDPQMRETPHRVAKMYINELFAGTYSEAPVIKDFENSTGYGGMVFSGGISVNSICAHHHVGFFGNAFISYIPGKTGNVIGLSKLNRIVDFFARRPQIQESLTQQIHNYIKEVIADNEGIAVYIEARHMCTHARGVKQNSIMATSVLSGSFLELDRVKDEFYQQVNNIKQQMGKF